MMSFDYMKSSEQSMCHILVILAHISIPHWLSPMETALTAGVSTNFKSFAIAKSHIMTANLY